MVHRHTYDIQTDRLTDRSSNYSAIFRKKGVTTNFENMEILVPKFSARWALSHELHIVMILNILNFNLSEKIALKGVTSNNNNKLEQRFGRRE